MDEILFRALGERVGGYLDGVERLAAAQTREVGAELRRLAGAWRALLRLHEPDRSGRRERCRGCRPARGSPGMCTAWRVAAFHFARVVPGAPS